jgi:hypothetical protein
MAVATNPDLVKRRLSDSQKGTFCVGLTLDLQVGDF